jgi:serine/threonine protein kinase
MTQEAWIAGRYEVLNEIARGGMGRVVRAHDRVLDREVAIKLLLGRKGDGMLRARFLEESQVTAQLAHPNVVSVHDLGDDKGEPYLVMKLVRGRTLRDVVKALKAGERKTLAEFERPRLLRMFLKTCEAVAYAHGRGVIHRDLKPSNVMVSRGDEVLVMDWGLAKPFEGGDTSVARKDLVRSQVRTFRSQTGSFAGSLGGSQLGTFAGSLTGRLSASRVDGDATHAEPQGDGSSGDTSSQLTNQGDIVGTPAYMPPEQADDASRLDPRADVYSLGAVLYELLVLRPPYEGGGMEVISALVQGPPPRPRVAAPEQEIPPALEAIVLKAMARAPAARYPDGAALAADVARWLDGRAVEAYRETTREAVVRTLTRHKAAVVTMVASLIVVQAALVGLAMTVRREAKNVERETAEARAAADEADAGRKAAEDQAKAAEVSARALALTGRCVLVASEVERRSRLLVPLDAADEAAGAQTITLPDLRDRARAELDQIRRDLDALGAPKEDLAPFQAEVDDALRAVDAAFFDALLARSPRRALGALDAGAGAFSLEPGQRSLTIARAHHRLGQRDLALRALKDAGAATGAAGAALRALLARAPLDEVERAFTTAIREEPDRAWLYLRRAETRARAGRFEEATVDYDRAAGLHRLDAWIYSSKVRRTYPLVSFHNETGLLPSTLALVHELAPENDEADDLMPRGHLWASGNWEAFRAKVTDKQANDPLEAGRLGAEGALIVQRWPDAETYAKAVLEREPDDPVGLGCLAEARLEQGDVPAAERLARQGLATTPDDARLSLVLGRALAAQSRLEEAVPHLERGARGALTSDPWRHLAECLLRMTDPARWEQGVQAARRGMALDPYAVVYYGAAARPVAGDPRLHRVAGHLRVKQGRLGAAIGHFMRAFVVGQGRAAGALGQDLQDAMHAGDLHERLGLPNEALALWNMAGEDPALKAACDERARKLTERFGGGR